MNHVQHAAPFRNFSSLRDLEQAADMLKALGHPHRLQMVKMLLQGRYTVGELAGACGIPSAMASEHLRLMQHCGMLARNRQSRSVYYEVANPCLAGIMQIVEARIQAGSMPV